MAESNQPVFAIKRAEGDTPKLSANILPCKIHHNGKVNASKRYWQPLKGKNGLLRAHFRGRRLQGKVVKMPDGYRSVILKRTSNTVRDDSLKQAAIAEFEGSTQNADPAARRQEEEDLQLAIRQGQYATEDLGVLQETAQLDEMVIWGHDEILTEANKPFSKGIEEWIAMAEAIHQSDRSCPAEASREAA